jgi:uncharacterized protein YcbX
MRVLEVWRYPVKSMGGERLDGATTVSATGIEGDRILGVVDVDTGKLLSGKTVPLLLQATARWSDGGVRITTGAGGLDLSSTDEDADARLSAWLGRDVRLRAPEPGTAAAFDLELDPDDPTELTELRTPPGSFFDSRSVLHLLTTASLGDHDVRRFRPNLLVEADGDHPEDAWVGREVAIGGDLRVNVRKATKRCVLVTKPQPGLAQESAVFRDLVRTRDGNLGIYLDPLGDGTVAAGAEVEVAAA